MLRGKIGSDDRQRQEQGPVWRDERLRKSAPFVLALAVGFLLAKRRDGGGASAEAAGGQQELTETLNQVRQRLTPGGTEVAGEVEREMERVGETLGSDDAGGGAQSAGIDGDVSDFSPPTVRGMPMLGVGTYWNADYDECLESVRQALEMGYRHVDAIERRESYYSEEAVGDAVAQIGMAREDLFVATKVDPDDLDPDHVRISAEESLDRLGMDYVDLLYVHWPTEEYDTAETLAAFAELRREGLIEEIGVSNFTVDLLEEAIEVSEEPIFANQVEMHPLLPQEDLRQFCARDDVDVELVAYSPIARGDVEDVDELQEVADKHDATPEQVSLAWLREKGVTAIPRATSENHLRENWLSLGVELDDEDVESLDAIEERRRLVDPDEAPWN